MNGTKTYEQLQDENRQLHQQLQELNDTIDAIRTGQVDAIIVTDPVAGQQLYTLKSADHTYRVFIEKMNEGAVTINRQGVILYCNSRFAEMVGMPLSKVAGAYLESFMDGDCQNDFEDLIESGWTKDIKMELSIRQHSTIIPCQLSVTTLELDGRELLSVIITDLSFQKDTQKLLKENNIRLQQANLQLEASNHDLQQFASVASHDLQEPLRKILIFSNMLSMAYVEPANEDIKIYLQKISSSAIRMRKMVDAILQYSRLSTNQESPEKIELSEVIKEIEDDYEILIQEKQVQLIIGSLPVIEGNRSQIKQVFQNLISNSIKFSSLDKPAIIRIFAGKVPGNFPQNIHDGRPMHCVTVEDNGIGFDMLYQDKIFSLFERLNAKESYEGSGIGLSITRKIVEKHSGLIFAESKPGCGSRFSILLPIATGLSANK
jgi:PAS domain S-box-containing protein